LPLLLFIGYLTAVHMVMAGSIRYRLPLEPLLIVLAAAGFMRSLGSMKNQYGRSNGIFA
jgi:hypothetical protein